MPARNCGSAGRDPRSSVFRSPRLRPRGIAACYLEYSIRGSREDIEVGSRIEMSVPLPLRVASWNVNGIRSACKKGLLEWAEFNAPDILCLQELKLGAAPFAFELTGYNVYMNVSERAGYSGVATLSRRPASEVETFLGLSRFDSEGRFQHLHFDWGSLVNVYIPHGGRDQRDLEYKLAVYDRLRQYIELHTERPLVLIGDFNVARDDLDLARPNQNRKNTMFTPKERGALEALLGGRLQDSFRAMYPGTRAYTWWPWLANARGRNIGWRLDYAFVSGSAQLTKALVHSNTMGSDHCPIEVQFRAESNDSNRT